MKPRLILTIFVIGLMAIQAHAFQAFSSTDDSSNYIQTMRIAESFVRRALTDTAGYHLLRELASIGHRLVGSENCRKAIQWAEKTMQERGFDHVFLQPVMVPRWIRGDTEKAEIVSTKSKHRRTFNIAAIGGSISTPPQGITAPVLEVKSFEELHESGNRAKGKIIFFNRPMDTGMIDTFSAYGSTVTQRVSGPVEAAIAGGVAAIVRSVTTRYDNVPHVGTLVYDQAVPRIPGVVIGQKDADFLSQALKDEPALKVKMTLSCKQLDDVESYNVIGEIIGSEYPDEIIVVGGHIDSWDKGDGSHDDGAGCIQSFEVLDLFLRLGIKPRRTIRAVFFMNEEFGLSGAEIYGRYAEKSNKKHIAAIESDRGAHTPRGFYVDACEDVIQKIQSWLPYLNRALIEWVRKGGSGADVGQIKNASALIGYVPDVQRYFDVHHSANDVFKEIHPREFELGTAAMAILTYLISQEGLQ